MKRYRDCILVCNANQEPKDLLQEVEEVSIEKGYRVEHTSSIINDDILIVKIKQVQGLPASRIVLGFDSKKKGVSILNIIPLPESGVSQIDIVSYNRILELFMQDVYQHIHMFKKNIIETNTEDYTIKEIIPWSFLKLDCWLNGYPLSSHPSDKNRWYDFVISLHRMRESLPMETLEEYVKERCGWDEKEIANMEIRLESQLDLLEYYDNH